MTGAIPEKTPDAVDCAIIVVSYNSADDLPALLASVPAAAGALRWRVIVVDNDSADDPAAAISGHDGVELVSSGGNLGYSGGLNAGLDRLVGASTVLFVNPDLVLQPGSIERLVEAAAVDGVGAVVPRIDDEDGRLQPSLRREPTLGRTLGEAAFGDHWPDRPPALAEMVRNPRDYREQSDVDWATGAAILVPAVVVAEIGRWDDGRFFMYSEETDYSRRIRVSGRVIRFVPDAVMRHRGAGSGSSPALDALLTVNKLRYYRKWHGPVSAAIFAAFLVLHQLVRSHQAGARASLRALLRPSYRATLPGEPR